MASIRLSPPDPFDFKRPDEWERWKRRFEQFRIASGLSEEYDERQVSTLLYCLGEEAEDVLASTHVTAEQRKKYKDVVRKFNGFFKVRRNVIFEWARFNRRNQMEGESVEQYITALYSFAENCEYGEWKDQMIRDRLVVGIRDTSLSERLQMDPDLTLENAKKTVRQKEAVKEQQQLLKGDTTLPDTPNVDHVTHSKGTRTTTGAKWHSKGGSKGKCTNCGNNSHPREQCPARNATCFACQKVGHFSAHCRSRQSKMDLVTEETHLDSAFLGPLGQTSWTVDIAVNGVFLTFKVDTGAEVTAISEQAYRTLGTICKLEKTSKTLFGPTKVSLHVMGQMQATLRDAEHTCQQTVYVVKGLRNNLLGFLAIQALHLLTQVNVIEDYGKNIHERFPKLFQGLGTLDEPYHIKLKANATPFALFTARNVPLPLLNKVKEHLANMEATGVISRVEVPTDWCAGMVVVPKKNGDLRICVDLKPLNEAVLRATHPLPKVGTTLALLSGAQVFSKLDANSGFWQIPLTEEWRLLTTFITPFGRYCFNKLPFGISSAPEHFQCAMNKVIAGLEGVVCLMDDTLVFGRSKEEHDKRLLATLQRIQAAGLTLNKEKCIFSSTRLKFLGHIIDKDGISADPDKTAAIRDLQPPKDVRIKAFYGYGHPTREVFPQCGTAQPTTALTA